MATDVRVMGEATLGTRTSPQRILGEVSPRPEIAFDRVA